MEKGCETCEYLDGFEGECTKGIADKFQVRDCDTSKCTEYQPDPFYLSLFKGGLKNGHGDIK